MISSKEVNKASWETTDFPILCESCLGDNPYVRMQKQPFGLECKICRRPYTVFKWKPSGYKTRYKKTEICQNCAKMKNVCQTCLFDLKFGLPVQVRDAMLGDDKVEIPQSNVMKEYVAQQASRKIAEGKLPYAQSTSTLDPALARHVKTKPAYHRNRARVCSFWLKGECTRGDTCPYRHEKPEYAEESPFAKQNIKDRYHGIDDPVALAMLDAAPGVRKFRKPNPPEDSTITTLWLGGVVDCSEAVIRQAMEPHGAIKDVSYIAHKYCAWVKYVDRASAEAAMDSLYGNLKLSDRDIRLDWGKSRIDDDYDDAPPPLPTSQPHRPVQAARGQHIAYAQPPHYAPAPPPLPAAAFAPMPFNGPAAVPQTTMYPSQDPHRMGSKRPHGADVTPDKRQKGAMPFVPKE